MAPEPPLFGDLAAAGAAVTFRPPDPARDAIDGALPRAVVAAADAEAVAATLAWASEHRLSLVIRGGGTKAAWGRRPSSLDVILDMLPLGRMLSHQHGDLTATVQAGITLGELNRALGARGQMLPLDPPFAERATIGGLLATNDSGPHRHRYGTPRDLVIGIRVATTDGRLSRAGGQVVKNVAGYDLSKLMSGSFGSLAAIVEATFKLAPVPGSSATVTADGLDPEALGDAAAGIGATQLEPAAFEFSAVREAGRVRASCSLRFASVAAAVEAGASEARRLLGGVPARVLTGREEEEHWRRHARRPWEQPGAIVRASWMPAALASALCAFEQLDASLEVEAVGRAGVGSGLVRIGGTLDGQASAVAQLRAATALGNVTVLRASPGLKERTDVWPPASNAGLLASVKRALDPEDILGAGRGPI